MRTSWAALHASLSQALGRKSSEVDFGMIRQAHPGLASFGSIAALMEHQHTPNSDPARRFHIVRTLVEAAQSEHPSRSTAHVIVTLALWPGLDAVFWRLRRGFPDHRDDLPADVLARASEAILGLDLDRVTTVTATLLRNVERDIRRNLIASRIIGEGQRPIDDPMVDATAAAAAQCPTADTRALADLLGTIDPHDAQLLGRVFIVGETQEEAGRVLGLSPSAARKRYQRAIAKLRAQKNLPALSHSDPSIGL